MQARQAPLLDADTAANTAASAFASWSRWTPADRARVIRQMSHELDLARDDLVDLAADEVGASRSWIDFNVDLAKQMLDFAAGLAVELADQHIKNHKTGKVSIVRRQAAGVCLGMVPWNAPITLGVRAVAGPLICGNTVVMKGSELCPRTHQRLVTALNAAGLPDGVLNCVINTPADAHDTMVRLIAHPCIRRINFTGSTRVGRDVAMEAARHLKPVLLELSGKAPLIVLGDADLDAAVDAACFGAFFNQGQICMSTEWIIVVQSVADAFVAKFMARLARMDADTNPEFFGPMVSPDAAERVHGLIEDAVSKGARLVVGGRLDDGVLQPTLLDGISSNMRVFHEEAFGPLASIIRVYDAEEAISIANASEFGLNAAVFSRDIAAGQAVADVLEYGVVQINGPSVHDDPGMPFGGMKQSGHGRFGGKSVIDEFTETRWIATHQGVAPQALKKRPLQPEEHQ
ncbi:aldehyde dehydrogenase family protein [Loktanella sp. SALINAS62]|uniref:aldehyde dehydrogenase family protein n=1 Tax=Loktanella sp. SALINAS62 TaxID=2706124 RepID=UPI0032C46A91